MSMQTERRTDSERVSPKARGVRAIEPRAIPRVVCHPRGVLEPLAAGPWEVSSRHRARRAATSDAGLVASIAPHGTLSHGPTALVPSADWLAGVGAGDRDPDDFGLAGRLRAERLREGG